MRGGIVADEEAISDAAAVGAARSIWSCVGRRQCCAVSLVGRVELRTGLELPVDGGTLSIVGRYSGRRTDDARASYPRSSVQCDSRLGRQSMSELSCPASMSARP